jgi:UDP-N-acetylmuramate--alanine ligase
MRKQAEKHVHMIGIGGSGLSAIARVLLESGYHVTGSDRQTSPVLDDLKSAGAQVTIGHDAKNISSPNHVIRSSAIPDENPEVMEARRQGIPVLKRADFLGDLMAGKIGIAVAGTHGKTTTTAMIAWIFEALGQNPTFIVGGVVRNLGVNARAGVGPHFIIEADEYDRMFLGLKPKIAVVTNIEHDHPDCYPTEADFFQAFSEFARLVPAQGSLIICADDAGASQLTRELGRSSKVFTYGIESPEVDLQGLHLAPQAGGGIAFDARLGEQVFSLVLEVPGRHNILNALAALLVAERCGLDLQLAAQALEKFAGTGRRFEIRGEANGVLVIDDYGHHPTEIKATLAAARARYAGRRLWAVWQPHTYTRTRTFANAFEVAFQDADQVLVTEVFASREQPPVGGYSASQIVAKMRHPAVRFTPDLQDAWEFLIPRLRSGDVLIVFSAGDADLVSHHVFSALNTPDRFEKPTNPGAKEHYRV